MDYSISKNKISFIHSLERKKERLESKCFVAEGPKVVGDLMQRYHCRYLVAVDEWLQANTKVVADEIYTVQEEELLRASLMKTPQQVLAIFEQRDMPFNVSLPSTSLCLALDNVQNPGNLGTIVRLADWFGIEHIICSPDCADIYNPKTVQATMGAMAHVQIHYTSLETLIGGLSPKIPVYGTLLDGNNIYKEKLTDHGIVIMGNEGRGIRPELEKRVNRRLYIPNYPEGRVTTDSLNVAVATAIVCAEFRRQLACS